VAGKLPPDVFFLSFLKVSASRFLGVALFGLTRAERDLLDDGVKQIPGYTSVIDLLRDLESAFGDEIGIVLSRRKYSFARKMEALPYPAVTLLFRIADRGLLDKVLEAVYSREKDFSLDRRERVNYGGSSLVKLNTEIDKKSEKGEPVLEYSYSMMDGFFAFSTSFEFLKRMMDARNDYGNSLEEGAPYETMSSYISGKGSYGFYFHFGEMVEWAEDYCYYLANRDSQTSGEDEIRERKRVEKAIAKQTGKPFRPSRENDERIRSALEALRRKNAARAPQRFAEYKANIQFLRMFHCGGLVLDCLRAGEKIDFQMNLFFDK
jgi:hypothetical protein